MTITIIIKWGTAGDDCPCSFDNPNDDCDHTSERFTFDTKAEADAFMTGVESACGWMEYTTERDDREEN